jgi:UDP-N-acetylmuramoyl-tripeptide--D-alanyl-D-alanine ligase
VKDLGLFGSEIVWEGKAARLGLPGKFNFQNAMAAIALAAEIPVSADSIRQGIESVKPLFGRGEILAGRSTVIRDCYNSNPESAEAVLDFCDNLEWQGRKVYVIGSMLELGDETQEAHAELGRRLASCRADMVFLFGDEIFAAADVLDKARQKQGLPFLYTCKRSELSQALDDYIKKGDLVLLKGSRGCELETLTEILVGETYGS